MRFKLETAADYYEKYEKDEVNKLRNLGFIFQEIPGGSYTINHFSEDNNNIFTEINTLEELNEFIQEYGKCIIYPNRVIKIYNGYVE